MAVLVAMGRKKMAMGKMLAMGPIFKKNFPWPKFFYAMARKYIFCDTYHIQCIVRWPSWEAVFKWNFTIISEILHQRKIFPWPKSLCHGQILPMARLFSHGKSLFPMGKGFFAMGK